MNEYRKQLRKSVARRLANPFAGQILLGESADSRLFEMLPRPEGLVDTTAYAGRLPRIEIAFYLGSHQTAEDARQMAPYIAGAHAVSYEIPGIPSESATRLEIYNMLGLDLRQHPTVQIIFSQSPGTREFLEEELGMLFEKEKALCLLERTPQAAQTPMRTALFQSLQHRNEMMSKFEMGQLEAAEKSAGNTLLLLALHSYLREGEASITVANINNLLLRRFLGLYELPEIRYLVSMGAAHSGLVDVAKQAIEKQGLRNVSVGVAYDAGSTTQDIELSMIRKAIESARRKLDDYQPASMPAPDIEMPFTAEELDRYTIFVLMERANPYTGSLGNHLDLSGAHSALAMQFSHQDAEELSRTYMMFKPGTAAGQSEAVDYRLREMNLPRLPRTKEDVAYILERFKIA
ncbi:MAG: hypothetical protein HYT72_04375 [Candidatus Aenigmarchaeota archaeon]|nr:hypothetical protein [Candidatus Aenigmarchaeota archaeon]